MSLCSICGANVGTYIRLTVADGKEVWVVWLCDDCDAVVADQEREDAVRHAIARYPGLKARLK